jgi:hypothetical protein
VPDTEFCVLNFYHLVDLPQVHDEIDAHRFFILGEEALAYLASGSVANASAAPPPRLEVRGRIYLSKQGINCQAGGKTQDCVEYARWVASRPAFKGLRYTLWPYPHGHAHPRLRLKHRPSLISLAGGMESLPITDASQRATPLEPDAWARMLATAQKDVSCFFFVSRQTRSPGRRRPSLPWRPRSFYWAQYRYTNRAGSTTHCPSRIFFPHARGG